LLMGFLLRLSTRMCGPLFDQHSSAHSPGAALFTQQRCPKPFSRLGAITVNTNAPGAARWARKPCAATSQGHVALLVTPGEVSSRRESWSS
jgi:hypothetical protein